MRGLWLWLLVVVLVQQVQLQLLPLPPPVRPRLKPTHNLRSRHCWRFATAPSSSSCTPPRFGSANLWG